MRTITMYKLFSILISRKISQGKTCFHYREPQFSLQGPCIHYREFPVRITTQGNPCSHYREWVCSIPIYANYIVFTYNMPINIKQCTYYLQLWVVIFAFCTNQEINVF